MARTARSPRGLRNAGQFLLDIVSMVAICTVAILVFRRQR